MTTRRTILTLALAAAALALPASADATTFCVPSFRPDCPNANGNVATPDPEVGMQTNAADGEPDRIEIAGGTYTDTESFETGGTDPLEIVGAGVDQVRLTTSSTGNIFVVNLYYQSRPVTMSGVTIVIPAAMADGLGGALQAGKPDTLDHVDILSLNPDSDGAASMVGGGSFSNGHIYGQGVGSIADAFKTERRRERRPRDQEHDHRGRQVRRLRGQRLGAGLPAQLDDHRPEERRRGRLRQRHRQRQSTR